MYSSSIFLLVGAAGLVAILHSLLPDHWVPLAIVARTQRWSIMKTARVSVLAATGHILTSLLLGGILAVIGLQFQHELDTQQGHIIGGILILTGIGFLIWGLMGGGHGHHTSEGHIHSHDFECGHTHAATDEHNHMHSDEHEEDGHDHIQNHEATKKADRQQTLAGRLAAIAVPFGVAASPDLTILPVALAASALGGTAIVSVLGVFATLTLLTFVGLTVLATLAGYQIKGEWLEKNANTITSFMLIAIGVIAFIGF